jgi:hypothetical protein
MNANTDENENDPIEQLAQDIARQAKSLEKRARNESWANELYNNTYVLLLSLANACKEKFTEHDEALDELFEHESSVIHADLAAPIFATIELARELCRRVAVQPVDDDTKKLAATLMTACDTLEPAVISVAVDAVDAPEDDIEDGEEVEGDDEEEVEAGAEENAGEVA